MLRDTSTISRREFQPTIVKVTDSERRPRVSLFERLSLSERLQAYHFSMAKLRVPREQVEKMLGERVRVGEDLAAKAELAESTGGYKDWLHLLEVWRNDTITELKAAYEGKDIAFEFEVVTGITEHSSPQSTFEYNKVKVRYGIMKLNGLIERLPLALPEAQDVVGIKSLHPEIYARCRTLYADGSYAEAVRLSLPMANAAVLAA